MSNRDGFGAFAAFLLGGILGAAAGILLAPEKGEETREKIKDWAEDKWEKNKEHLEDMKADIEKKIVRKKKQLGKKLHQIKDEITASVLDNDGE
ncbi:hypothetical protein FACS189437_00980 [Bacteroidia bacterium]|nr:hypothetical protein FACS189437_00980 [Bacteroidia bacterium]